MKKQKKLNRLLLALVLTVMPVIGMSATVTINDIEYDDAINPGSATVTGYAGTNPTPSINIESTVTIGANTLNVTHIADDVFYDDTNTINIIEATFSVPSNITTIGHFAFTYNQLTNVIFPNSVTSIGGYAFDSNNLIGVSITNDIAYIGEYAFRGNGLTTVTFGNGVTSIGSWAFSYNNLTSVTIPDSMTAIERAAFAYNPNLTEVWFEGDAPSTFAVAGSAGSFAEADGKTLYYHCTTAMGFTSPTWQGYNTGAFCNVTFDSQGGSPVDSEKVIVGNTVTQPMSPARSGYAFNGWFADAATTQPYDFSTTMESTDITLYAGWKVTSVTGSGNTRAIPSIGLIGLFSMVLVLLELARRRFKSQVIIPLFLLYSRSS